MTTIDRNDYLSIVIVSHGSTEYTVRRERENSSGVLFVVMFLLFTAIFCWKVAESVLAVVGGKYLY